MYTWYCQICRCPLQRWGWHVSTSVYVLFTLTINQYIYSGRIIPLSVYCLQTYVVYIHFYDLIFIWFELTLFIYDSHVTYFFLITATRFTVKPNINGRLCGYNSNLALFIRLQQQSLSLAPLATDTRRFIGSYLVSKQSLYSLDIAFRAISFLIF